LSSSNRSFKASPLVIALLVMMTVAGGYLGFAFFSSTGNLGKNRTSVEMAGEVKSLTARLPELIEKAQRGEFSSYAELREVDRQLQESWGELQIALVESADDSDTGLQFAIYASIFLTIGIVLLALISYLGTRRSMEETADKNKDNQDSILRLLDEIEGLGEGDLTVEVTVAEGFTGAIADAINLTIVQLRELVSRIVDSAAKVSSSANETRETVVQLTGLSEHQAGEITGVSSAINEMVVTIDQVSANAAESAVVADRSVSIANKGAEVVRSTIEGMDNIREQIQDTAKRIKRLGESSQEIGNIVSLINDIADQTNILALNAAIQASMAGDAGRGFAVVADEVQRLAERSANASKQIAALVKTIQTDTNEAVSSMEQTTAEVVAGASLTENAGVALSEIETVSTSLAELIQVISTAARKQSTTAGHISKTMDVIQDITTQTLAGTNRTVTSVADLADMAVEQRESVSGFKLSDRDLSRTVPISHTSTPSLARPVASASAHTAGSQLKPAANKVDNKVAPDRKEISNTAEEPAASAPAHIKEVLKENSSAMNEMDSLAETVTAAEATPDVKAEVPALNASAASGLEAELADLDLDEFDIEPDDSKKK
jgi:methyl-accepting chemotaxis protein